MNQTTLKIKPILLSDAERDLGEWGRKCMEREETFVVCVDGRPSFAIAPILYDDEEDLGDLINRLYETNSDFRQLVDERKNEASVSTEEVLRRLDALPDDEPPTSEDGTIPYEDWISLEKAQAHLREYGELCKQGDICVTDSRGLEFWLTVRDPPAEAPSRNGAPVGEPQARLLEKIGV